MILTPERLISLSSKSVDMKITSFVPDSGCSDFGTVIESTKATNKIITIGYINGI